jgi:hypothetical protein
MEKLFNSYVWQARIYPALIVLLPIAIVFIAWVPKADDATKPLIAAALGAGLVGLVAPIARDAGKKAERKLLTEWGAFPSTILLRHRDSGIDPLTKHRYHELLSQQLPGLTIPTEQEEEAKPDAADQVYQACAAFLRAKVRDEGQFSQLLAENVAYGFRRNLFGLRPLGIGVALLGVSGCTWKLVSDYKKHLPVVPLSALCLLVCMALLIAWFVVITKEGVRRAADDYGVRLLETIDRLNTNSGGETPPVK